MSNLAPCVYQEKCSGCQNWGIPYLDQLRIKEQKLNQLLKENQISLQEPPHIKGTADRGHRNRLDFTLKNGALGLFEVPTEQRKVLDINFCEILDPLLNKELNKLRCLPWKFSRANFQLRLGKNRTIGLAIDAANTEIKNFLQDFALIKDLLKRNWIVEVGQKGKELVWNEEQAKLGPQELRSWNSSFYFDQEIKLYGLVSSFVQPSFLGQDLLRESYRELLLGEEFNNGIEFGSGNGNWTFTLLENCQKVTACEQDFDAIRGLQKSLEENPHLKERIILQQGDLFKMKIAPQAYDFALVNPARSGLRHFANELTEMKNLKKFLYISCYPESFFSDFTVLRKDYEIKKIHLIDQFPQTKHFEMVALFQRVETNS